MLSKQVSGLQMADQMGLNITALNNHQNSAGINSDESYFGILTFIKIVFYLIFVLKVIGLSFKRRKRYTLKEKIYRKFRFTHQQILQFFTDEDKSIMETTLNNTVKNTSIEVDPNKSKIRRPVKCVSFKTNRNEYYEHINWREFEFTSLYYPKQRDDIEDKEDDSSFQQKKLEEQFIERQDLLGLNEKEDGLLPLESVINPKASQIRLLDQNLSLNIQDTFQSYNQP